LKLPFRASSQLALLPRPYVARLGQAREQSLISDNVRRGRFAASTVAARLLLALSTVFASGRCCTAGRKRLTNGFSKKLEIYVASVGLYVAHYNFCRVHKALGPRQTPAIALGLTDHVWTIGGLCRLALPIASAIRASRYQSADSA